MLLPWTVSRLSCWWAPENGQDILERIYYLSDNEGRFVLSDTGGMIEVENEHEKMPVGIFDYMNYDGMEHLLKRSGRRRWRPGSSPGHRSW